MKRALTVPPQKKKRAETGKTATAKSSSDASSQQEESAYFSRSIGKAFLILNLLSRSKIPLSLSEIASLADLTKSSCFRLLFTLQTLRYLSQNEDGRFSIAADNWVNSATQVASSLPGIASESIQRLNSEFRETISLAVLFSNHIEVVHVKESPQVIRMANTVGRILPPHASSLGKAITAFQTPEIRNHLLQSYGLMRLTDATITDEALVLQEFEAIRKNGVAHEAEESTPEGCCFGCPIFLDSSSAVAAISISIPKSRLPETRTRARLLQALRAESKKISQKLHETIQ
jgi:DNA-binding IclR family transcriptional regulator